MGLFKSLIKKKSSFIVGSLVPLIMPLLVVDNNLTSWLYLISTEILSLHIIYGGYAIFKEHDKITFGYSFFGMLVWFSLMFLLPFTVNSPLRWYAAACLIFIFALFFHKFAELETNKKNLKIFCEHKMKIEIKGILFFIVFAGLSLFLNSVVLASINLLAILFVNFDIFFNKKLYKNFLSEEAIKNL